MSAILTVSLATALSWLDTWRGAKHQTFSADESVSESTQGVKGQPGIQAEGVDNHDAPERDLLDEDKSRNQVAQLWLRSRLIAKPKTTTASPYRAAGRARPIDKENALILVQLIKHIWRPFVDKFWKGDEWEILGYLIRRILKGFLPAGRLWASSKILDIVQKSLKGSKAKPVSNEEIFRAAMGSMFFSASKDIYDFFARESDRKIVDKMNHRMERAYIQAQISLSIPSSTSEYVSALMYEAGVFVGTERPLGKHGLPVRMGTAPFETAGFFFTALTQIIEVFTQFGLLIKTLLDAGGSSWTMPKVILILMALAPTIINLADRWIRRNHKVYGKIDYEALDEAYRDKSAFRDFGKRQTHRQEILLFGLKDWIISRWDDACDRLEAHNGTNKLWYKATDVAFKTGKHSMETIFYVLLARGTLGTTISLGKIRLYQSTASSLLSTVDKVKATMGRAFQSIFYLAAFLEATRDPEGDELRFRRQQAGMDTLLIDYETTRADPVGGGMSIEARNLSFSYAAGSKPILHSINLSIKVGETLAIVGFNGGGKTTLTKVLMGLYDHQGELLINGVDARSLDPATLHKRTSCLFQDFSKYSLTLKENVGMGDVGKMKDLQSIKAAIEKGGAEKVRAKVGLNGRLNPSGMPSAAEGDGDQEDKDEKKTKDGVKVEENADTTKVVGEEVASKVQDGDMTAKKDTQSDPTVGSDQSVTDASALQSAFPEPTATTHDDTTGSSTSDKDQLPMPKPDITIDKACDKSEETHTPTGAADDASEPRSVERPADKIKKAKKAKKGKAKKEEPVALSGGQWQRVALSRAFLRSDVADLVVFDLDPRAEAALFQRIHALSTAGGRKATTIYISHRFSTADQIAVVEDGTIVENGSHTELMLLNGRYAELFNLQKEGYEE